jgi:hypothetical protein
MTVFKIHCSNDLIARRVLIRSDCLCGNFRAVSSLPLVARKQVGMVAPACGGQPSGLRVALESASGGGSLRLCRLWRRLVYITVALAWLWMVENQRPSRWDIIGATVSLIGNSF